MMQHLVTVLQGTEGCETNLHMNEVQEITIAQADNHDLENAKNNQWNSVKVLPIKR